MDKNISVTINGIEFNIEENAYETLQLYLKEVENYFEGYDDQDEITEGIEERICERFSNMIRGKKKSITKKDVNKVIETLGKVEDFDPDSEKTTSNSHVKNKKTYKNTNYKTGKKLFRNEEESVVAGVCSGLAAYFGIDLVFIRILFAILVFVSGFGVLLYVVLWIAMPKAKTIHDKMIMQGHPLTVSHIEKFVKSKYI
jgi:phage shock protein PspC (stress-responsive transcriptional regulator)